MVAMAGHHEVPVLLGFVSCRVSIKTWIPPKHTRQLRLMRVMKSSQQMTLSPSWFYPPCQIFSAAHARVGRNDESNKAPLLAIEDLPKKIRLRLVTLEGTSSLIRTQDSLSRFHDLDLDPRLVSASNGRCLIFSFSVYHCPEKGQVVLYIL